jgi:hypothetical protein
MRCEVIGWTSGTDRRPVTADEPFIGLGQIQARHSVDYGSIGALRCLAADQPH